MNLKNKEIIEVLEIMTKNLNSVDQNLVVLQDFLEIEKNINPRNLNLLEHE